MHDTTFYEAWIDPIISLSVLLLCVAAGPEYCLALYGFSTLIKKLNWGHLIFPLKVTSVGYLRGFWEIYGHSCE